VTKAEAAPHCALKAKVDVNDVAAAGRCVEVDAEVTNSIGYEQLQ
jgi:hypothetical protein